MGISSYIARQLAVAIAVIVLSLTCIVWLIQSLRFVDIIVNHGLALTTFVHLTLLLLPTLLSIVLPIAGIVGVIYIYHRMAGDREITVLEAAGISPFRLACPAIMIAALITGLCYLMTLYLVPVSYGAFKTLQFEIRHSYTQVLLREGVFNMVGDNITVYVRKRHSNGDLKGMIVHDGRDPEEKVTLMAESGALVLNENGPLVFLNRGNRQSRDARTGQVSLLYFDSYSVDLGAARSATERLWRDQNELFLPDLLYPDETVTSPRNFNEYIAEGHYRLTAPLLGLTLPLIGLALLLRNPVSRRNLSPRVLLAVGLAIAIECGLLGSKMMIARHPWLTPAMYLVALLPGLTALLWLSYPPSERFGAGRLREPAS